MLNKSLMSLAIFTVILIFIAGPAISIAQQGTKIGGTISAAFSDRKDIDVGDTPDHIITLATSGGTNTSTGTNAFLDGAQVTNYSMGDLVKGNGHQNGYIKLMKGTDGATAKWEHNVVTKMSDDGKPMTTFEGKFTYTGGMGKYAGIKGGGTFKGKFTSPTEYVTDWQGEYTIVK